MSSSEQESPGAESESSSKIDFTGEENKLRKVANARLLKLLKDPDAEVPAGQLMAFVAKVGFRQEVEKPDQPAIKANNVLAILPGLPPERAEELLAGMQAQIDQARKELPSGSRVQPGQGLQEDE